MSLIERMRDGEPIGDDFTDAADKLEQLEAMQAEVESLRALLEEVTKYVPPHFSSGAEYLRRVEAALDGLDKQQG